MRKESEQAEGSEAEVRMVSSQAFEEEDVAILQTHGLLLEWVQECLAYLNTRMFRRRVSIIFFVSL